MSKNERFPRKKYMGVWRRESRMMMITRRLFPRRIIMYMMRQITKSKIRSSGYWDSPTRKNSVTVELFPVSMCYKKHMTQGSLQFGFYLTNPFKFNLEMLLEQPLKSAKKNVTFILLIMNIYWGIKSSLVNISENVEIMLKNSRLGIKYSLGRKLLIYIGY